VVLPRQPCTCCSAATAKMTRKQGHQAQCSNQHMTYTFRGLGSRHAVRHESYNLADNSFCHTACCMRTHVQFPLAPTPAFHSPTGQGATCPGVLR
jgi:hypothetical protein